MLFLSAPCVPCVMLISMNLGTSPAFLGIERNMDEFSNGHHAYRPFYSKKYSLDCSLWFMMHLNFGAWLHFSAAHIVLSCVTMSHIWYPPPIYFPSAQDTTTKPFNSPKHTVDTFEGWINSWGWSEWDQTDRFIYRELEKEPERKSVRSCMCLKGWTEDTEQGRMIFFVLQSLSSPCLLQLAPARFTSPALM